MRQISKLYLWTIAYFRPYILMTLCYVLCGGFIIWGELMIPRKIGYLIDHILPTKDMTLLNEQIFFLSGIVVLVLLVKMIYQLLEKIISNKIVRDQQVALMHKLQTLGFSYYERVSTGKIISLFENAVRQTQQTYTFLFPQFIYSLAQFIVPSFILLKEQSIFFLASMIGNILYVTFNKLANKKIAFYLESESRYAHILQQHLYDVIAAKTEIQSSGREKWLIDKTRQSFKSYREPRMKSVFWRHFRYTTVGLTLTISIVLFYVFGLRQIQQGTLLFGEFIGYSFLMGLVSRGFSVFFYIIPAQLQALNYAKYLYDFMKLEAEVEDSGEKVLHGIHNKITFENVSFSYNDEQKIIDNLSFEIPIGQKTALVGESGCGKSTLLKLIGRFYDVTEGNIYLDGVDIKDYDLMSLREELGYVFQETYLFNMSIKDNIKFGQPDVMNEKIVQAAKVAGAHDFIVNSENGYESMVGERGVTLSGGQKQRIAIARMMVKSPSIILLDEATSALDTLTEASIKTSLDEMSKEKTVVAVAHRLSTIEHYDQIIVLGSGGIVERGNYNALMEKKGTFYRMVTRGQIYEA